MTPTELRLLLDLWMLAALDAGDWQTMTDMLTLEVAAYGFTDVMVAYHEFSVSSTRVTPSTKELVSKLPLYCDDERRWDAFADAANENLNALRTSLGLGPR